MSSSAGNRNPLAEAKRLEREAIEQDEESAAGRKLRAKAAALRVQALGKRSYPILVCQGCFAVTGWLSSDERCDSCLRHDQLEAAYRDPHGGWVAVADPQIRPAREQKPESAKLLGHLTAVKHPREAHQRALVATWMTHVRPDETGPIAPEDGYQVEVARREEVEAADGSGMLIRFHSATAGFHDGAWVDLQTTRIPRDELLAPTEISAAIPAEQIVDAWGDYKAEVDAFNRRAWDADSARREAHRQGDAAHDDAMREQRDVFQLLDEE